MRIRLLGTGTPTPSLRRQSSGYVINVGSDVLVFDHGFGAHHRLLELGVKATDVTHLFFTHLHYDHCGDYGRMILTRWDQGAGEVGDLKVFGPAPLTRMTDQLFGVGGVYESDLVARTSHGCSLGIYEARGGTLPRIRPSPIVRELKVGDSVGEREWSVEVGDARHFQPYLTTFAFRLKHQGVTFVYSGDSGPCPTMEDFARGADVLVHMCHYLSGTALNEPFADSCMGHMELARLAEAAKVQNLVLTHITEQFDKPGIRERVIGEMAKVYSGNLFFGEDLMEIPVTRPGLEKLM
jgi:ribonuclease Z